MIGLRRTLDGPHGSIGIQTDHQRVAFAPRRLQIADMPGMQEIEHAVGEHDDAAGRSQLLDERDRLCERHDLLTHDPLYNIFFNLIAGENVHVCRGR